MKKRIRHKIIKRFQDVDSMLSMCFVTNGGFQNNRKTIALLRRVIQYWRRRYPRLYLAAFGTDGDIGHWGAGR